MSTGGDVEKNISFLRRNTPEERARMQNERRKRKRKARAVKKEEERKKVVLALEDERAKAKATNERLLYLARKYYTKWQTLHRRERVRRSFYEPNINLIKIIIAMSNLFRLLTRATNYDKGHV